MDDRTLEALKGSIRKWEGIVAGTMYDDGIENCPLCQMFHPYATGNESSCSGCPVRDKTGKPFCRGTPYSKYAGNNLKKDAQVMLDFLRDLLPTNMTSGITA